MEEAKVAQLARRFFIIKAPLIAFEDVPQT